MFFTYQRAKFSTAFRNDMMSNSLSANVMLYFLNILLILTLLTHPFIPFMTPSAAAAPQTGVFETLADFFSWGANTMRELQEAIALAGGETRQSLQELHDNLESLIGTLSDTYQNNLNITLNSLDAFTTNELLKVQGLIDDINEKLQENIQLISKETQDLIKLTSQELRKTTIQLEKSLSNVVIVSGETTAYVIDRAMYSTILTSSFILLALGILLFIWLLFIRGLPGGCLTRLMVLTFMVAYMALLGSFLLVPDVRAYALTYTGSSLGDRLDKVVNEPRVLEVRPDQIVLGETKELEIWGSLLRPQSITPIVKIGDDEMPVEAATDNRIVVSLADLEASEGSTNLVLLYEGLEEEEEPSQIVQVLTAFCLAYQEQEEPNQVLVSLCPDNQEEEKPEEEPEPHEVVEVVKLLRPTPIPRKPPDLVLNNLSIYPPKPKKREKVTARAKVCNDGEQTARGITVYLKLDTSYRYYDSLSISNLNPGSCEDIRFDYLYSQKGQFNTQISISSQSQDSNPNNNQKSQGIEVFPRVAQVTVSIDKIRLTQVHDDNNWPKKDILEMFMYIKVNGRTARWPNDGGYRGMGKGHVNLINKKFTFPLEDDQPVNIYLEAWDADDNADDFMGSISQQYDLSGGSWRGGTYTKRGSQPGNGSYEVTYTIQVDWS